MTLPGKMKPSKPLLRWAVRPPGSNEYIPESEGSISISIAAEAKEEPTKPEFIPEEMEPTFSPSCQRKGMTDN